MSGRDCKGCGLPPSVPHASDCSVSSTKSAARNRFDASWAVTARALREVRWEFAEQFYGRKTNGGAR